MKTLPINTFWFWFYYYIPINLKTNKVYYQAYHAERSQAYRQNIEEDQLPVTNL